VSTNGNSVGDSPAKTVIACEGLSRWYGQVIGINDVNLKLTPGITGLLGPNGAGKSTFFKLITGQIKPSRGNLTMFGQPVWDNPDVIRRIGFCPEQDALYESMTGFKFVECLVRLNGYSAKESKERALNALEVVNLVDAKDKKVGAYSKGMRQRVKLAQALAHEPELLVLDEPLAGMDPIARRGTIKMIRDLAAAGGTIIVSSHILHEVEAMTKSILLVHNGRIVAEGNVHEIRDLIDEHPHKIRLGTGQARLLAETLIKWGDVQGIKVDEEGVVVETTKPDAFYSRLPQLILDNNLKVDSMVTADDNLQAVFEYLVQ
jgi:ABC-2 type transport system ATP-binding protein